MVGIMLWSSLWILCPVTIHAEEEQEGNEIEQSEKVAPKKIDDNNEIVSLEKCVDGDTANFKDSEGNIFKTRFLAIDTPETVHPTKEVEAYGKDASNYTCDQLTEAKEIRLEYDPAAEKEDKYNRRLAWVFVDDVLLQKSLVELGYAEVAYLYDDYKYTPILQDTEALAKAKKVGIWSEEEEKEEQQETETKEETKKEEDEKKSWIEKIIDYTLGQIFKYIDKLLEKIVKVIEDML